MQSMVAMPQSVLQLIGTKYAEPALLFRLQWNSFAGYKIVPASINPNSLDWKIYKQYGGTRTATNI